ncbi:VOC family protein [Oricola thermophila]|uniref:VOC family protein n=1 Tax=Oricola thermophila TaxID=2742145 RepID=A0A6N1VJ21_9HYPH|nr:VOC family protein [Oricola thermophila]QKV19209.1 VOC family protein [Oricola thermophila]
MTLAPFHLAFPVDDLESTRRFYCDKLGCAPGRSSDTWFDFSLYGHQMSAHLRTADDRPASSGAVDGKDVPIPHFGVVLPMEDWKALAARLEATDGIEWIHRPMIRFEGQPGEQATLFIRDPSGNALEFKGFTSLDAVFAQQE